MADNENVAGDEGGGKLHPKKLEGQLGFEGDLRKTHTHTVEWWQFLAFVFGAVVTLFFAVMDSIVSSLNSKPWWLSLVKVAVFFGTAYLILRNKRVRNKIIGLLPVIKQDRY